MKSGARNLFSFECAKEKYTETICGDNSEEETPVPIPNTEVKLLSADDTWWETAWESRTLPLIYLKTSLLFRLVFICIFQFNMRKGGNSVNLRLLICSDELL